MATDNRNPNDKHNPNEKRAPNDRMNPNEPRNQQGSGNYSQDRSSEAAKKPGDNNPQTKR